MKNVLSLKPNLTLRDLQKYVAQVTKERGFDEETAAEKFIYLLDICNHFDIDLEKAFRHKEKINERRTWE